MSRDVAISIHYCPDVGTDGQFCWLMALDVTEIDIGLAAMFMENIVAEYTLIETCDFFYILIKVVNQLYHAICPGLIIRLQNCIHV